jgi:hypothetical protein
MRAIRMTDDGGNQKAAMDQNAGSSVDVLLGFSRIVDWINHRVGWMPAGAC